MIRGRAPGIHGVLSTSGEVLRHLAIINAPSKTAHGPLLLIAIKRKCSVLIPEDEDPGLVLYSVAPASSLLIGGDHGRNE